MRQLQITAKGHLVSVALDHNLGILTSIDDLTRFDMIYVYHQLLPGTQLSLKRNKTNIFDENCIEVYYKNFKLGHISAKTNAIISRLIDKGMEVRAQVKNLFKEKYMPLHGLDIEIKAIID